MTKKKTVKKEKLYKCPYCEERKTRTDLVYHIDEEHEDMIPQDYSASRLVFNMINKKESGKCTICGKETAWNEQVWRYNRYCSDKCHKEYVKIVKTRMVNKYGKEHILDNPDQQIKMLSNRSISGKYKFQDGGVREYVGSYEKKLLEFYDKVLNVPSNDIISPGPIVEYEFNGKKLKWITDLYYVPANLVHDVKDGGDNPNNREMGDYRAKQIQKEKAIKELDKYNYIRLTNNNFQQLILLLAELKELMLDEKETLITRINEGSATAGALANTNAENNTYVIPYYMDNVFVGTAVSKDKYMKDLYLIKDGKVSKSNIQDLKEYAIVMYEYKGKDLCKIDDILHTHAEDLPQDYFYTAICKKRLLHPSQFEFDELLEHVVDGYTEGLIKKSICESSIQHQFRELTNSNNYVHYSVKDVKMNKLLKDCKNVVCMSDLDGIFGYNHATACRTPSFNKIDDLYSSVAYLDNMKV